MNIYIDADGSPVVKESIHLAKIHQIKIIVVKNFAHEIIDDYAKIVSVDIAPDSADHYIINHIKKDDVLITQDYGLASLALSKGALAINQNGMEYTINNIDLLLEQRFHSYKRRKKRKRHSNNKKRTKEDGMLFIVKLDGILNKKKQRI